MATSTIITTFNSTTAQFAAQSQRVADVASSIYLSHLTLLEVIGLLVAAAFVGGTAYIIIKTEWLAHHIEKIKSLALTTNVARQHSAKSWDDIQRHFFAGNDNDLKVAVLDADKLLDEALRNTGVFGSNLGDRLKKIKPGQLPNVEAVWQAHKLRNQIAHESDFAVKRAVAERALTIYEEALQHLGAIPKKEHQNPSPQ